MTPEPDAAEPQELDELELADLENVAGGSFEWHGGEGTTNPSERYSVMNFTFN